MNKIRHTFSFGRDKVMPELHLRQPGFAYSDCGPFTKTKNKCKKL